MLCFGAVSGADGLDRVFSRALRANSGAANATAIDDFARFRACTHKHAGMSAFGGKADVPENAVYVAF
jgi:hypothetical protein